MATLGEIRKQIDPQACSDAKAIFKLFMKIAETNPQAVIDVMGHFAKQRNPQAMVELYHDNAEYLAKIFDCS